MGARGPAPTPTRLRIIEGNPSRRPLPTDEPHYAPGIPQRPRGMSEGAKKAWEALVTEMAFQVCCEPLTHTPWNNFARTRRRSTNFEKA
jgi:hypothetical protein